LDALEYFALGGGREVVIFDCAVFVFLFSFCFWVFAKCESGRGDETTRARGGWGAFVLITYDYARRGDTYCM
jgi:hypothetical protein